MDISVVVPVYGCKAALEELYKYLSNNEEMDFLEGIGLKTGSIPIFVAFFSF